MHRNPRRVRHGEEGLCELAGEGFGASGLLDRHLGDAGFQPQLPSTTSADKIAKIVGPGTHYVRSPKSSAQAPITGTHYVNRVVPVARDRLASLWAAFEFAD